MKLEPRARSTQPVMPMLGSLRLSKPTTLSSPASWAATLVGFRISGFGFRAQDLGFRSTSTPLNLPLPSHSSNEVALEEILDVLALDEQLGSEVASREEEREHSAGG